MATILRKNTVKITFPASATRPTALEIHNWIEESLHITPEQVEMIQLHSMDRAIYIKLVSVVQYDRLMSKYDGVVNFRYENGNIIAVNIERADVNTLTVRLFNLPPEVNADIISKSLNPYGLVKSIRAETWSTQYKFPVNNGVRAIRMDIRKPIPNKLIMAGYPIVIHYQGQPQLCHICGEISHLRSQCPRKKFVLPVTTTNRKPLLSEIVGGMSSQPSNNNDENASCREGEESVNNDMQLEMPQEHISDQ